MKKKRMLKLADAIEQSILPLEFNMDSFSSSCGWVDQARSFIKEKPCGMAACIGGWACILFGPKSGDTLISESASSRLLGLSYEQSQHLFYNEDHYISPVRDLSDITREEAVKAIRRMVEEEG